MYLVNENGCPWVFPVAIHIKSSASGVLILRSNIADSNRKPVITNIYIPSLPSYPPGMKNTSRLFKSTQLGIPYHKLPQERERENAMPENSEAESLKSTSQSQSMAAKKDAGRKEGAAGESAPDMGSSKSSSERADEKLEDVQGKSDKEGDEKTAREEKSEKKRKKEEDEDEEQSDRIRKMLEYWS